MVILHLGDKVRMKLVRESSCISGFHPNKDELNNRHQLFALILEE